jgi:hypothetical protein
VTIPNGKENGLKKDTWWSNAGLRIAYFIFAVSIVSGSLALYCFDRSEFSRGILVVALPVGVSLLILAPYWRWRHRRTTEHASRIAPLLECQSRIDTMLQKPERTVILILGMTSDMTKSLSALVLSRGNNVDAILDIRDDDSAPGKLKVDFPYDSENRNKNDNNVGFVCWSPLPESDGSDPALEWFSRRLRVRGSSVPLHGALTYFLIEDKTEELPKKTIELRRAQLQIIARETGAQCPCFAVFGHDSRNPMWQRMGKSDYLDFPGPDSPTEDQDAGKAVLGLLLQYPQADVVTRDHTKKSLEVFFNQTLPSFVNRRINRRFTQMFAGETSDALKKYYQAIQWNRELFRFAYQWRSWWRGEVLESFMELLMVFRNAEPATLREKTFHGCFLGSIDEQEKNNPQWVGVAPCIDKLISLKGFSTLRATPNRGFVQYAMFIGVLIILTVVLLMLFFWLWKVANPTT